MPQHRIIRVRAANRKLLTEDAITKARRTNPPVYGAAHDAFDNIK